MKCFSSKLILRTILGNPMHNVKNRIRVNILKYHLLNKNTFVSPGRSTSERFRTDVEYILRTIGSVQTPLLCPALRLVSCSISLQISPKSVKTFPFVWRNFPHSSRFKVPEKIAIWQQNPVVQLIICTSNFNSVSTNIVSLLEVQLP